MSEPRSLLNSFNTAVLLTIVASLLGAGLAFGRLDQKVVDIDTRLARIELKVDSLVDARVTTLPVAAQH